VWYQRAEKSIVMKSLWCWPERGAPSHLVQIRAGANPQWARPDLVADTDAVLRGLDDEGGFCPVGPLPARRKAAALMAGL
jgi:hypothetical protein